MGFPSGYTEVLLPNLLINTLSLLGLLRNLLLTVLGFMGLTHFLEPDPVWPDRVNPTSTFPSVSASLIRDLLPVVKFSEIGGENRQEICAVCLYEFKEEEEIRRLRNCRHIFHRSCVDRWMDHDQKTCPLCRTPLVPEEMQGDFNERVWVASGYSDPFNYGDFSPVSNFL